MITRVLLSLALFLCLAWSTPVTTQTVEEIAEHKAQLEARALEAISTLEALLETRADLESEIASLKERIDQASEAEAPELTAALEEKGLELSAVDDQLSLLATGVSETEYNRKEPATFDLQEELETLIQPFILILRNVTEEARAIEATKRQLAQAQQRLATAKAASEALASVQEFATGDALVADLTARAEVWTEREAAAETGVSALEHQLDDLLSHRVSAGAQVQSAAKGFFRERGLSLMMGVGAFMGVFMVLRFARRLASRHGRKRNFYLRLANLLFVVFTIAASITAMLIVFNQRNDWLLLGIAALILLALIWIGIRMLPGLVEQITILLNLGAVQENERVIFNGVPFRVRRLDFYTDLENPDLDGGEFTLPIRELTGLHSRPAAEDEAWFPSRKNDWVRLADGNAGQVIAQTPEMVVLRLLGGSRVTYQTADYLAQTPENLSHGYRVTVEFGIGYAHQAEATDEVMETMREAVRSHMSGFVGDEHIIDVGVDFLRAGASSLDYEVEIDLHGSAAERFDDIERELARALVKIATKEGWEIPFQQIVLHQAKA